MINNVAGDFVSIIAPTVRSTEDDVVPFICDSVARWADREEMSKERVYTCLSVRFDVLGGKFFANMNPALRIVSDLLSMNPSMSATVIFLMVGHMHEDMDQVFGGKVAAKARPKPLSKKPEDVAHDDSGSEYESDGSEVLRSDGSLNADARSSGPTGPRSAGPRSECSFREHFRREPPRGKDARSRSRSPSRCSPS